ncbi:unnamed protein product [Auanema sp. JU1783]|nr:unnamed protein product [Auanema sp. JU1783]
MDVDEHNGNVRLREGFHIINIECRTFRGKDKVSFEVPTRYYDLQYLNAGAQGTVVSAMDRVTGKSVAIKKMLNACSHPLTARRAYREFVLLTTMKHPNIIQLLNAFTSTETVDGFTDIYVVMELMSHNLAEIATRMRLEHRTLSFFVYQMLCAIKHLHNSGVIHRDLKPSNIVVDDNCKLKVLDFGLARVVNSDPAMRMSDYVVTRYYRAPEVVLSIPYDEKVDIWSVGCILAELVNHSVLFEGKDRIDQWTRIIKILGTPSEEFINTLGDGVAKYVRQMNHYNPIPVKEFIPDSNFSKETELEQVHLTDQCRDLLAHMLEIDPRRRYSVENALHHPYVKLWWDEAEVNGPRSENRYNNDVEVEDKPLSAWKSLIFEEIKLYEREHDIFKD